MEYEKGYIFEPDQSRPAKRRKTEAQGLQSSWSIRREAYGKAWSAQQSRINTKLDSRHDLTVDAITSPMVQDVLDGTAHPGRIPASMILTGPGSASRASLSEKIVGSLKGRINFVYASLDAASAPNLKAALKTIIQKATSTVSSDEGDEDEVVATTRKGPRLLNYDLQILSNFVQERNVDQVVVAFQDTEALSSDVLSELIELMCSWQDRIPFWCLFNIATSIEFLQERLSRDAVRSLQGFLFDAEPTTAETQLIFETMVDREAQLWIGPNLLASALERQSDYIQSVDSFVDMIQYAYMSCFYANALSVFLIEEDTLIRGFTWSNDHYEAIRSLDSFHVYIQALIHAGDLRKARGLLDSNAELLSEVSALIAAGRTALSELVEALKVIRIIQGPLSNTTKTSETSLYMQAMSNKLRGSALLRSSLLALRKSPSGLVSAFLGATTDAMTDIPDDLLQNLSSLKKELVELSAEYGNVDLRSADDIGSSSVRTTVVAQKVHLNKQKSELSKQDAAYTDILRRFSDTLNDYFEEKLIDPQSLPLHEFFLYDLKSPHREVFTPRPRHAIERALAAPHDYLDCECCAPGRRDADEATLSATQPATAVLYQLYLESGMLINVSDLWQAFRVVMGDKESEEGLMALFERGLAEMRYLGMIKSTRKRVDHVAKVAWKGL